MKAILFFIFFSFSTLFAQSKNSIGLSAGVADVSFTYDIYHVNADISRSFNKYDIIGQVGFIRDGSLNFTQIPINVGIRYFLIRSSLLSPYITANGGIDYINIDAPKAEPILPPGVYVVETIESSKGFYFSYGFNVGTLINISKNLFFNFDINLHLSTPKNANVGDYLAIVFGLNTII